MLAYLRHAVARGLSHTAASGAHSSSSMHPGSWKRLPTISTSSVGTLTVALGSIRQAPVSNPSLLQQSTLTPWQAFINHCPGLRAPWPAPSRLFSTQQAAAVAAMQQKARRIAFPVGTAAGLFGGLVGVGGGVLIAPVIVNACKTIPQRVVAGTSLAAVAATGAVAGSVYWTNGAVDLQAAAWIAASALLAAPLGAFATTKLNCQALRSLLGYWLYLVAPLVPLKVWIFTPGPQQQETPASSDSQAVQHPAASAAVPVPSSSSAASAAPAAPAPAEASTRPLDRATMGLLLATGAISGFASGLLGIGGGTIVTPLLAVATGMPHTQVLGTSLAAMILPSLVGLAKHSRLGNVDWAMAARLAGGTAIGGWLGSKMALEAPPGVLEMGFAVAMILLGNRTLASVRAAAKKG